MKYGDYSYITDKTAGQIGNYYVDKARNSSDIARYGAPKSEGATYLGRDTKGRINIPKEGIPQEIDEILLPEKGTEKMVDPRIAEADGTVYSWDDGYVDTSFTDGLSDVNDEEVVDNSFARFRGLMSAERGATLTSFDRGIESKIDELQNGTDESYDLTIWGQWDKEYAKLQKIKNTDVKDSIGAFDFMKKGNVPITAEIVGKEERLTGFWKEGTKKVAAAPIYKRPPGANDPELPYNAAPPVAAVIERSKAMGLAPASD